MDRFLHESSNIKYPKTKTTEEMNPKKKKNEPKKKKMKNSDSSFVGGGFNNLRLTSQDPCSSVTNDDHHKIHAPPRGWGWVGGWMRVRVRMRCELEWESVRWWGGEGWMRCEWGWEWKSVRVRWDLREAAELRVEREMSFRVRFMIYIYM